MQAKVLFIAAASTLLAAAPAFADDPAGGAPAPDPNAAPATGAAPAAAAPAPAAAGGAGSKTVGADVLGVLPLGDYSNGASFAIGAAGRFEYGINDMIAATARVGYLYHLGTPSGESLYIVPIMVGGTYKIGTSGLSANAEIGLSIIGASVTVMGVSGSNSSTKFGFDVGVGYQKDKIKARLGFYMPGSEDNGNTSTTLYGILASVGYDFVSM